MKHHAHLIMLDGATFYVGYRNDYETAVHAAKAACAGTLHAIDWLVTSEGGDDEA
ncbi:MAG: hypothetical protein ACRCV6_03860 [Formosimonas sp.]